MKRQAAGFLIILFTLSLLPGCCRYICWGESIVPQNRLDADCYCYALRYIRSLHIYDQLNTVAHFDALWLSDEIRTTYAQLYSDKRMLPEERYEATLQRQYEENQHYVSFIVLAAISDSHAGLLSDKSSLWGISLDIGGIIYQPAEIKIIELLPEYRILFGKTWTKFKTPYLVRFDATGANGNHILDGYCGEVILLFASPCREPECMKWLINGEGCVIEECGHENRLAYDL
jgi:hypothetical protein